MEPPTSSPSSQVNKFFRNLFRFRAPTQLPERNDNALVPSSPSPKDTTTSKLVIGTLFDINSQLMTSLVSIRSQYRGQREQMRQLRHQHDNLSSKYYHTRSQHKRDIQARDYNRERQLHQLRMEHHA
ncbi:hypothetical protein Ptr902_03068 [Pyrenophora tritici-repentis]|nr:hypothetical protein PtrV1_08093 [Pyrenophora tritici-repentis]KAF7449138.1 hypothetical protein A1F99_061870 [Pyrenophora tritici-repentis]KAI0626011.1 hypothetical protein TUN199_02011 [Pyrenophora tritici-repentis]KAI2484128.1 hypothetical protein Ptr902_03068 [Pyrenophora tritici-repentis]PZD31384.1 hypothetical protein A1F96_03680 [Pyrenophora tritici-repentis]